MRCHYTFTKINNCDIKCWWECRKTGSLTLLAGMWNGIVALEKSLAGLFLLFLIKLNIKLPYDPVIALLGINSREMKTSVHTKTYTQMFIVALFMTAKGKKKWKQSSCLSMLEKVNKLYIHTVEYSAIEKNELLVNATTWMTLQGSILSGKSQF